MPQSIVVGIANVDRKRDFTFPTNNAKDKKDFPTTGSSEKFIDFIEKELQPHIQRNYRTGGSKTIVGQSSAHCLLQRFCSKNHSYLTNTLS
jgi:predicted alpha/beta superfamily hydrolase